LWAFPGALIHLERALAACDRMPADAQPPTDERLALLDRAADVAYLAGTGPRSVELAQTAIDLTDAGADPAAAARRYAVVGRNNWGLGDSTAAFAAYRHAVELMPSDPPTAELAHVLAEEARGFMLNAHLDEAEYSCR